MTCSLIFHHPSHTQKTKVPFSDLQKSVDVKTRDLIPLWASPPPAVCSHPLGGHNKLCGLVAMLGDVNDARVATVEGAKASKTTHKERDNEIGAGKVEHTEKWHAAKETKGRTETDQKKSNWTTRISPGRKDLSVVGGNDFHNHNDDPASKFCSMLKRHLNTSTRCTLN